MSDAAEWQRILHVGEEGEGLRPSVLRHIRDAARQAGYVSRGRITSGLRETYRPLGLDEEALTRARDEALDLLLQSGDLDELSTAAGRGYAPTPARRLSWGGSMDALLGAIPENSSDTVRRIPAEQVFSEAAPTSLLAELGHPAWRSELVALGGTDDPQADATLLSAFAQALASSGERYALDEPNTLAVLSGRGDYFGSPEGPNGRWARASEAGFFPAEVTKAFAKRRVLLMVADGEARLWEPPTRDLWNWIVVGFTLAAGDAVWRYDQASQIFEFLTPPPRQAERAALLAGEQLSPWSWRVDPAAQAVISGLLGSPRA